MKRGRNVLSRVLSLLMVFAMVLAMVPTVALAAEEGTTLYLKPNANWLQADARFAAYFFEGESSTWVSMTDSDNDGYYEVTVPDGYTNVIFCRMNPSTTENNWDNKWNQTSDLTVPTDGNNCYTVAEGTWDQGEWSAYTPDTVLYLKPNANWLQADARFAAYFFEGESSTWVSMTDSDNDGYYEVTVPDGYTNVIFCRMNPSTTENNWDNKWNQTSDLTIPTDDTNCYTIADGSWDSGSWSVYPPEEEPEDTTGPADSDAVYYVAGESALCGSNWSNNDAANKMTQTSDGKYEKVYTAVAAGTYSLKVTDGTWDNTWGDNGSNYTFIVSAVCDVTVTFDPSTSTVTVTGDNVSKQTSLEITAMYAVGNGSGNWLNGKSWDPGASANAMTEVSDNVYEITFEDVAEGTYEFKFAANGDWTHSWGCGDTEGEAVYNGNNISLNVSYDLADVTLSLDMTGYDHSTKNGAKYSVTVTEAEGSGETEPSEPEEPEGNTEVTLHFTKPTDWGSNINAYLWTTNGAVAGYSDYNSWPGKTVSDTDGDGWYDLAVTTESQFNFIFNDGSKQTADLTTGEITGDTELWVVGNDVYTEKPDYTIVIHYQKPAAWGAVYAYVWNPFAAEGTSNAIPGYEAYNAWPGATIEENENNPGWYDLTISKDTNVGFNFIFNNGSGTQTGNLWSDTLSLKGELWFYADETSSTSAPDSWFDPNRKVYVPGTFPGPSWDAASNQMTYDPELGLYVYTFENVTAAKYEYKIAINGSWDENYGANGVAGGDNMSVRVPVAQDVTIWYNDHTHRAQCSIYYELNADISVLNGEETIAKMTDPGLTGLYTATVTLAAGEYEDLTVQYGDLIVELGDFELTEEKEVTFYFDPSTKIAYHNASGEPIDTTNILFDSKDLEYKDPYGAVANGEEVTFRIQTGTDATNVSLIVKGEANMPMTKDGEAVDDKQMWTVTTTFADVGEYEYYFAISNGSSLIFYTDDIYNAYLKTGDFGTGAVRDINNLLPYDLVVYQAGYETPDWMKNAVVYQIFPDRFFDGDESNNQAQITARGDVEYEYVTDWYLLPEAPSLINDPNYPTYAYKGDGEYSNEIYGGDLKGITEKIDYLKALGVNVIYLNPVFSSISNHRYDACDYMEIDPILGTLGDFEELVEVAEANGMHIILDGVFNHVSDDSVYFDRYYKFLGTSEKIGAYPYWAYVYDYMVENEVGQAAAETAAKKYFSENYGITDYSYTEWFVVNNSLRTGVVDKIGLRAGKEVYSYEGWWGYDSMPVVYSTNGSEYQTGNWAEAVIYNEDGSSVTQYWISKGSDGWRLDVANEVSDETWINFRNSVKAMNSEAVIVGEIWSDATYYLMGNMYDSVMNYVFRDAVAGFARGYQINRDNKAEKWDSDFTAEDALTVLDIIRERYPEEAFYAMMNLVASHDTARILSYLDDVEDDRYQTDIANSFPMYETTSDRAKQLQYVVSFIQFTYAGAPTIYYGDEIGMVGADDPDDRRAFTWGEGNQDIVEWYAKMAAIRAQYPALRTGSVDAFAPTKDVMGYVRSDDSDTLIVMANRASSAVSVTLDLVEMGLVNTNTRAAMTLTDLISGQKYEVVDGKVTVTVPAYRGVILTENVKEVSVNTAALASAYSGDKVAERCAHAYTSKVVDPTCTKDGYTERTCSKCGNTYQDTETKALGHKYESVVTKPTCTEKGYTTHTCSVCGDSYKDTETPALGHKYESVVTKPTCTEKGYTTHTCSVCGDSYKDSETAALGHDYKSVVTKPTATKKGYTTHTCKVCGHSYVDSYTDPVANAPTGDNSNIVLWGGLLVLSMAGIGVLLVLIRRKRNAQ